MYLNLYIQLDNAAFTDAPMSEAARILRELADRMERDGDPDRKLMDINGNAVGESYLSEERSTPKRSHRRGS